ncbi:hypothetical protein LSAT2_014050 [Lamellibrachia satsuma]|nr:hypothetical protein LSAT2_014050 [Lamellibrachia satsuma]
MIYFTHGGNNMTQILLVALLLTLLMEHGISGARCRFDRTSASRGTCIFPCRCTKGCDHVTGQCLDNGQCNDGSPSGYKWRGTACQTGNVALNKATTQSTGKWGDDYPANKYPASQAVDGAIDPLFYQHCAVPNARPGTDVWWKVDFGGNYKISRVIIYNGDTKCKVGYFGWRCRFQCHKCSTCDAVTGECPVLCQDNRWGVGCLLGHRQCPSDTTGYGIDDDDDDDDDDGDDGDDDDDDNDYYYDNKKGSQYMGLKKNSRGCIDWTRQTRKRDSNFPDGSRAAAKNFCRNPDNGDKPWCYYNTYHDWVYCDVRAGGDIVLGDIATGGFVLSGDIVREDIAGGDITLGVLSGWSMS